MHAAIHSFEPNLTVCPRYNGPIVPSLDPRASIGVFDSGVGGLTVARALARRLTREQLIYVADQAHVPYGGRPLFEVKGFAEGLTAGLFHAGAKAVVMGCNVSSAVALPALATHLPPGTLFGVVEPGARAALARSRLRRIGLLATEGTVSSGAYRTAIGRLAPDAVLIEVACPDFVPLIESGSITTFEARRAVRRALSPLHAEGVDVVILGCTHYPFLRNLLREESADSVEFIDPAEATAEEVYRALKRNRRLRPGAGASHHFLTSGDLSLFRAQLADFAPGLTGAIGRVYWRP